MIQKFDTYEHQIKYLSDKIDVIIPKMTAGYNTFFKGLFKWEAGYRDDEEAGPYYYLLPDPSLNLALPYPRDEINATLSIVHQKSPKKKEIVDSLERFSLGPSFLAVPTNSLSCGERVLLAFAKAYIYSEICEKLFLCSPTQWLNISKYHYINKLIECYKNKGRKVECLILKGEPMPYPNTGKDPAQNLEEEKDFILNSIPWDLTINQLDILFQKSVFPRYTEEKIIKFRADQTILNLESPTLLKGDNGIGKSILAKILSGLISPTSGTFSIAVAGSPGYSRLLLQDSIDQLFGESVNNHLDRVFYAYKKRKSEAESIYRRIESQLRQFVIKNDIVRNDSIGSQQTPNSLLQSKIMLIAERIVSRPPLLILDEPGWGLSKHIARTLVKNTIRIAEENNIAIMIISHIDDWWVDLVKSTVLIDRKAHSLDEVNIVRIG